MIEIIVLGLCPLLVSLPRVDSRTGVRRGRGSTVDAVGSLPGKASPPRSAPSSASSCAQEQKLPDRESKPYQEESLTLSASCSSSCVLLKKVISQCTIWILLLSLLPPLPQALLPQPWKEPRVQLFRGQYLPSLLRNSDGGELRENERAPSQSGFPDWHTEWSFELGLFGSLKTRISTFPSFIPPQSVDLSGFPASMPRTVDLGNWEEKSLRVEGWECVCGEPVKKGGSSLVSGRKALSRQIS